MPPVRRRANAKLNLALSVGAVEAGRGLHRVAGWVHAIDLFDDVFVEALSAREPGGYGVAWAPDAPRPAPIDWPIDSDLAVRAHAALSEHAGRTLPARIEVRKRIPAGAGLGGGSSDAAGVLLALRDAFSLDLPAGALRRVALGLGSDVPFFLDDEDPPRPALVTGVGEEIERVRRLEGEVLLVVPSFLCATRDVYAAFDRLGGAPLREREVANLARRGDTGNLFNDLDAAAVAVRPALGAIRRRLEGAVGARLHLTGSGSALFALAPGPGWAARAAAIIREAEPGCAAVSCRLA